MNPFVTLARTQAPDGAELSLHQRGEEYFLRVNNQPLMATNAPESEKVLAQQACKRLYSRPARVLIGGLGFGFSLRRVLEIVGKDSTVHVAELLPAVVQWNREFLGGVNGKLLDDPRVTIFVEDVFQVLERAKAEPYDAVLLDVDNGPVAMVQDQNGVLYHRRGLGVLWRALKPGGRAAFWSASDDAPFAARLAQAGFRVSTVPAKSHEHARRFDHLIFVGDRVERSETSQDGSVRPKPSGSSRTPGPARGGRPKRFDRHGRYEE